LKLAHCPHSLAPTLVALPSISLIPFAQFFVLPSYLVLASMSALKFEAFKKGGHRMTAIIEGKIMNLSVETKVAIAVATSFVVLIVGAMAQG
jgi:hypothetical protein